MLYKKYEYRIYRYIYKNHIFRGRNVSSVLRGHTQMLTDSNMFTRGCVTRSERVKYFLVTHGISYHNTIHVLKT